MRYLLLLIFFLAACTEIRTPRPQAIQEDVNVRIGGGDVFTTNIHDIGDQENFDSGPRRENLDVPPMVDAPSQESMPPSYPGGPFSLELFGVVPNMTFYDPWEDEWIELSDFYKHEKYKAIILVSSAGWCGPCLIEAASLISLYNKYQDDGLEIIYTLGNTNNLGDVPFDTDDKWTEDILFMESWRASVSNQANDFVNYNMYADPKREFLPYLPNHAWPLSILVTTKDMGIRLVEEGYWSALVENKVHLVLYNDVPNIPFE